MFLFPPLFHAQPILSYTPFIITFTGQDFSSSMRQRPSKREFDPYKAEAINLAKTAQDFESCLFSCLPGPFYSIDVECVAIGYGHSERQRYPGRIALVNDSAYRDGIRDNDKSNLHDEKQHNNNSNEDDVLLDEMIDLTDYKSLTSLGVVSYMTDLTGLTSKTCSPPSATKSLDEVRDMLREILPPNAVLVGHGIGHDLDWIGLKKGEDFREFFDTTIIFRQRIPRNIGSASKLLRDDARRKMEELETGIEESNIATGTTILMEKEVHTVGVNNSDSFQNSKHDNTGGTNLSNNNSCNVDGHPVSVPESTLDVTRREVEDVRGIEKKEYPEEDNLLPFPTRYRLFSLRHCCIHLLGIDIQKAAHNPVKDARYSLFLFHQYKKSPIEMLRAMRDTLHRTPVTPSYASEHPVVDGVCLSLTGYRHKWAGRLVWNWWNKRKTKWNDYDGDGCYKKFEI